MNLNFNLVKTDIHGEPDYKTYIKWGLVIMFFGISTTSFIVQGALVLKDAVFGPNDSEKTLALDSQNGSGVSGRSVGNNSYDNPRGSDDVNAGSNQSSTDSSAEIVPNDYSLLSNTAFPRTSGRAFLAADLETGEIIIEQNEDFVSPVASVTKLMTALIAYEKMDLQKYAIVSRDAYNTYGGQGKLNLGDKIKIFDLMYPVLMESSNDGTEVVAEAYETGRAGFMLEMNKKAKELQMFDTYYDDPSGLSPRNVSSVRDLMKLGRYIYQKDPSLYDMTRVRQYSILGRTWNNQNRLLNYNYFLGGKNGYIDEARKTTVSLFEIPMAKGGNRKIIITLLKSDDREGDVLKIIDYLKKNAVYDIK